MYYISGVNKRQESQNKNNMKRIITRANARLQMDSLESLMLVKGKLDLRIYTTFNPARRLWGSDGVITFTPEVEEGSSPLVFIVSTYFAEGSVDNEEEVLDYLYWEVLYSLNSETAMDGSFDQNEDLEVVRDGYSQKVSLWVGLSELLSMTKGDLEGISESIHWPCAADTEDSSLEGPEVAGRGLEGENIDNNICNHID